jgi:hypothetical protein
MISFLKVWIVGYYQQFLFIIIIILIKIVLYPILCKIDYFWRNYCSSSKVIY